MVPDTLRSHFDALLDLDPKAREAAFSRMESSDPSLARRLRALLKAHAKAGDFLQAPIASLSPLLRDRGQDEAAGESFGNYTLLSRLGEGTFSVVWLARQTAPFQRDVALKILKPGLDVRTIAARFDAERDVLARLEHPGISRIYDAGIHTSGRPYFVMERVDGRSITQFAESHHLNAQQIVALFLDVLQAVEYAHRAGIVHRDLKPANVLVAEIDGTPTPKVIDFGIAKVITPDRSSTQTLAVVPTGSPAYMSPEQFQQTDTIDERTDVYSLGCILFELLTGALPKSNRSARNIDELLCNKGIAKDLRQIVLHATAEKREERFASPASFGAALREFTNGGPFQIPEQAAERNRQLNLGVAAAMVIAALFGWACVLWQQSDGRLAEVAGRLITTPTYVTWPPASPLEMLWKFTPAGNGGWTSVDVDRASRRVFAVSSQRNLHVFNLDTGESTYEARPDGRAVIRASLSADSTRLAVASMEKDGSDQRIIILDPASMRELDRVGLTGALYAMTFVDTAGKRLALSVKLERQSMVKFIDVDDRRRITDGPSWQVNFTPSYLVAAGDNRTVICNDLEHSASRIDSDTGRIMTQYARAAIEASSVNVSAARKLVLLTGAFEVLAIDLGNGAIRTRYRTIDRTTRAGFTAAERVVVTGTLRQQLVAFEHSSGKPLWIRDFPAARNRLAAPTFVPGESLVIITSMDGSISVGRMPQSYDRP